MLLAFLLGFLPKLAVTYSPFSNDTRLFVDENTFVHQARILAQKGQYGMKEFRSWRMPLYPVTMAIIFEVFGEKNRYIKVFNAILWGLSSLLLFLIMMPHFSVAGAFVATFVLGIYPYSLWYSSIMLPGSMMVTAGLAAFYFLFRFFETNRYRDVLLAALMFTIANFVRAINIAFPFVIAGFWYYKKRHLVRNKLLIFLVVILLPHAIWLVRNFITVGGLVPAQTSMAGNLLLGHNAESNGTQIKQEALCLSVTQKTLKTFAALDEGEKSQYALVESLRFAFENPLKEVMLGMRKMSYLYNAENRWPLWFLSQKYWNFKAGYLSVGLLVFLFSVPWILLVVFAARALLNLEASPFRTTILIYFAYISALSLIFIGEARYHLPLVPFLAMLATVNFTENRLRPIVRRKQMFFLAISLVFLISLAYRLVDDLPMFWNFFERPYNYSYQQHCNI